MLEMLLVANSAFAIIKKTLENGKELHSAGSAIATFIGAEDKLKQDLHKKKNSLWTNFLGKTDNDLEEFMALESIRVKQEKLREYMQLFGRANLYTDYIQFCATARRDRKEARIKDAKRKEHIKDLFLKIILAILITAMLAGVVGVLLIVAKKRGLI
tara:strand:+ start:196 stop:666 length:471 start_codon:yes stop_codon:yes gene_type:complete